MNSNYPNQDAQDSTPDRKSTSRTQLRMLASLSVVSIIVGGWLCMSPGSPASSEKTSSAVAENTVKTDREANSSAKQSEKKKSKRASCCGGTPIAAGSKTNSKETPKDDKTTEVAATERKPVLDAGQFAGMAGFGYASAKAAPEVMEKLFCYCGCDVTDSHNSLLDCFTSMHGVDCHICQEEAVLGLKLHKDGLSIKDIQQTIDEKYSSKYPFEEETATYKKYKKTRLWTASNGTASDTTSTETKGAATAGPDVSEATPAKPPKLKPGHKPSKCCAPDHDHAKSSAKDSDKSNSKK